jgi:phosphotransferase system enzyme I (PtsI)
MTLAERELSGIGVGRGLVVGDVRRMPDPLPEPAEVLSSLTPDAELVKAKEALAETSADLRDRGARAGGLAQEVLDALAPVINEYLSFRLNFASIIILFLFIRRGQ